MPEIDPKTIDSTPLIQELAEIGEGKKSLPKADGAKRHHFIPKLTLKRFAGKNDRLFQLDVKTGKPQSHQYPGCWIAPSVLHV